MVSSLSQSDIDRLLAEPSARVRADVARKLAGEIDNPQLTQSELEMAQDIVRVMAKDAEMAVRRALSQNLRGAKRLPHDVAVRLANDVEAVALPILTFSSVLTDADLIDIVRRGSVAKQEAIAGRPDVSEQVSDALIESAHETAVTALMENKTARISDSSLGKAVDRFAQSEKVKASIVRRERLPVTVTERLVALVSEKLQEYLVTHHELPVSLATDIVLQSRERTIINFSTGSSEEEIERLVRRMHANQRLTPTIVLRAICMGDMEFFAASLAVMAKVPVPNAHVLIHDAGRKGLVSLYEKAGMPPRLLAAVRVAVDVVEETKLDGAPKDIERYRARVISRILTQYEDFAREDLDYLLDKLGDVLAIAA
jgi:uncharacterized protein (DUF2336 family)